MFSVRIFRDLIPYKKAINLLKEILKEDLKRRDIEDIRFSITKICGYIAKSEGSALYPNDRKKYLNKVLKWTSILDKKIREIDLKEYKKKQYRSEILQIRKILISLRNKLEEIKNE